MKQISKTFYLDKEKTQPVIITYNFQSARINDEAHTENICVSYNGQIVLENKYAEAFSEAQNATLPDGRTLALQLKQVGNAHGLYCFYAAVNGQPLLGSSGDPYAIAKRIFWVLIVYGGLNVLAPTLIILSKAKFSSGIEFDWTAPAYGTLLVITGFLMFRLKHEWPLYIALAAIFAELIHFAIVANNVGMSLGFNLPTILRVGLLLFIVGGIVGLRKPRSEGFWT